MSQVNKHGNLINLPQFKIYGEERRKLKKERDKLKSVIKNFWFVEDLNQVYGCVTPDLELQFQNLRFRLFEIEKQLAAPFI